MEVKDFQPKQGSVNIELDVVKKGDVRQFQKFGREGRVCNIEAKDKTGKIKISLWNEQIDMINEGDKIRIENGYISEWQGEMQLTTGRLGKIEVIGKAEASSTEPEEKKETRGRKKKPVDSEVKEEFVQD